MISTADKKRLRALRGKRSNAELKALFALIRAHNDRALLVAMAPPRKRAPKRAGDPLMREIEQNLRPLMAPAAEKAELLVEHLAAKHKRALDLAPRGLADAVRRLRAAKLSDAQIRTGSKTLIAKLAEIYNSRETVV